MKTHMLKFQSESLSSIIGQGVLKYFPIDRLCHLAFHC